MIGIPEWEVAKRVFLGHAICIFTDGVSVVVILFGLPAHGRIDSIIHVDIHLQGVAIEIDLRDGRQARERHVADE